MSAPMRAGESLTITPAFLSAAIFESAPPLPPLMMAPAWPMRRPGGAVRPAMKLTTGLDVGLATSHSAAASSASPPISPIIMMPSVSGSAANRSRQSTKLVPLNGSPPMPTHVDWPRPTAVVWPTASYVSVPLRDTMPTWPGAWMWPGMMPILHSPGLMMPGQLGPMRRVADCFCSMLLTRTMSFCGMPSVMHTTSGISAATASSMAPAANGGGT
mmetsp:Transcript_1286/g.2938  ORF Transcript_1286/g.2938 Transcript_1286/m.2938 type:complete len:215 (-) Transcript_1286:249-893(-)